MKIWVDDIRTPPEATEPGDHKVVVHSANSVGIDWLEGMIERYKC